MLSIHGDMQSFVAQPNPSPSDVAVVSVNLQAFISAGTGSNQFIPINESGACGYSSTSQPFGTCNGSGTAPGPTVGTAVRMRNNSTGNWKFRIIVLGNGVDFDSDFGATVEWLGFEVRDTAGNLQTDYVATSASGIDWSMASVPEPGPAAGGWVALLAAAALARRGRSAVPR